MFSHGFKKIAVTMANITPEEYYELLGEKDPLVGAALGSLAGTAVGLKKGPKKHKGKWGLIGHGVGAAVGGTAGHYGGGLLRRYQAHKVRKMQEDLNLRATPARAHHYYGEG